MGSNKYLDYVTIKGIPTPVTIFVSAGIGGDCYGTFYRTKTGSLKRVIRRYKGGKEKLPMNNTTLEDAQIDLDYYAIENGLKRVVECPICGSEFSTEVFDGDPCCSTKCSNQLEQQELSSLNPREA